MLGMAEMSRESQASGSSTPAALSAFRIASRADEPVVCTGPPSLNVHVHTSSSRRRSSRTFTSRSRAKLSSRSRTSRRDRSVIAPPASSVSPGPDGAMSLGPARGRPLARPVEASAKWPRLRACLTSHPGYLSAWPRAERNTRLSLIIRGPAALVNARKNGGLARLAVGEATPRTRRSHPANVAQRARFKSTSRNRKRKEIAHIE
jgi:hypothetical protein